MAPDLPTDLPILTNHHALYDPRILIAPQRLYHALHIFGEGEPPEGRVEVREGVADFVYGEFFGTVEETGGGVEGGGFEEIGDVGGAVEKIAIPNVLVGLCRGCA